MKRFFTKVDYRSRKAMTQFLQNHFRYFAANSWNGSQSYACNLKLYNLGLDHEIENKLYDLMDTQEFFCAQKELLDEFGAQHSYLWQAGMNGRRGGYLVLYQGEMKPSGYKSFCTECGQKNCTSGSETGNMCGACRAPARTDFTHMHMNVSVYPGRGTDGGEDFVDWSMFELKERVRLVQELDALADKLVDNAIWLAKNYAVEEVEVLIPQSRKVLVPA